MRTAATQFLYEFDLGDTWTHLRTVDPELIDPMDELGMKPRVPVAYFGWGAAPPCAEEADGV